MIPDDDLLLYYYRDGLDAQERARIGAALGEHPELARRLHSLVARLDAAAALPEVPVPAHVQQRWRSALEQAARQDGAGHALHAPRARRRLVANPRWLAAAAAVAVIALAVIFQMPKPSTPGETARVPTPPAAGAPDASAYERGLKFHLASTERQLAGLDGATPEERARLIDTIIAQNRMYALAAERAGQPQLARVLRAFAPLLEGLRDGRGDASADLEQLGFELRVMQGRLGTETGAKPGNQSTTL